MDPACGPRGRALKSAAFQILYHKHSNIDGCGCRWILRADPEAGLEMLLQARPPLAPVAVLPILAAQVGSGQRSLRDPKF